MKDYIKSKEKKIKEVLSGIDKNSKKKKFIPEIIVWSLFFAVLSLRLFLAFKTHYFSYESYFNIREVQNILEKGGFFKDPLTQGGILIMPPPLFYYFISLLSFLFPLDLIAKIVPNIFYSLLIPISYYFSFRTVENRNLAIFSALFVAFFPSLWSTINYFSPFSLAVILIFYGFYCVLRIKEKKYLNIFIVSVIISAFSSPITLIIIPTLWLFILLLKIEKIKERNIFVEATTFLTFLILLIEFLIYKKAIFIHGYKIIWRNIPQAILQRFFENITIIDLVVSVGILSFVFGIYALYKTTYTKKDRNVSLTISIIIVSSLFMWLKLIEKREGIIFLGVSLAIMSPSAIKLFMDYFKKVKIKISSTQIKILIIVLLLITTIPPSIKEIKNLQKETPEKYEIEAMLWLKENSSEFSRVVAAPKEGFLINAIAKRNNVIDYNFINEKNSDAVYNDVSEIYQTQFETRALELLNKHRAKYIILSRNVLEEFNVSKLIYAEKDCFATFYENEKVKIIKTWCELE